MILGQIIITQGDITEQQTDAIVNAANRTLLGGSGVDGAIHKAAGPLLLEECRQLNGCQTGEAKITKGYNLPASWVIHTVGPIWQGGNHQEDELLAKCYQNSLELADKYEMRSIAFPAISTGVYQFPKPRAAKIAIREVKRFLEHTKSIEQVIFVCFTPEDYNYYRQAIVN